MGIFSRHIEIEIDEDPEGRVFLTGTLKDTRLGQPVHHMVVRAAVDLVDGHIHSLEGEMPHVPFEDCRHALLTLERLVGEEIKPGFTQLVRDVVGSSEGLYPPRRTGHQPGTRERPGKGRAFGAQVRRGRGGGAPDAGTGNSVGDYGKLLRVAGGWPAHEADAGRAWLMIRTTPPSPPGPPTQAQEQSFSSDRP